MKLDKLIQLDEGRGGGEDAKLCTFLTLRFVTDFFILLTVIDDFN